MRPRSFVAAPGLLIRSARARREGRRRGIPGLEFDRFGRWLGLRLILSGRLGLGAPYLLNPVSIVRYFEFPFVAAAIPEGARKCADVSSPRLFSLFWSATHPGIGIDMLNPDPRDLEETGRIAALAGIPLRFVQAELRHLRDLPGAYDAVWAISVLEHVHGDYDDREAIAWLYSALRPGGVLVITVMTDRKPWDEYRDHDPYRLEEGRAGAQVFFQRWYDLASIHERLLHPLSGAKASLAFFGERRPGVFKAYEADWMRRGLRRSVEDPREIAANYREYPSWEAMPGAGVCGIRIVRPPASDPPSA